MATVPCLKDIVLKHVCSNIDVVFHKKLDRIRRYLKENGCNDVTEFFIDDQELNEENNKQNVDNLNAQNTNNAVEVLRNFLRARGLPKIVWKETCKNARELTVELNIDSANVKVEGKCKCRKIDTKQTKVCECKSKLRYLAAKLLLRKLFSRHLEDLILQGYSKHEKQYKRKTTYESESNFKAPTNVTVETIDELQAYRFTQDERMEILRNIPEYRLRRSHYILFLKPDDTTLDFSFCPSLFSVRFFKLLCKKAKKVESVNLENCKYVNGFRDVKEVLRKSENTIMCLNINNCQYVGVDNVFMALRKHSIDLKELYVSKTIKRNERGAHGFQMFFNPELQDDKKMFNMAGRLIKLDLSGLALCEQEMYYVLKYCKRLVHLNLCETKRHLCYCHTQDSNLKFDTVNISQLREFNISRSDYKSDIQVLLLDNNPCLEKLYAASCVLSTPLAQQLLTKHLMSLKTLDISFQGGSEYEDFSLLKQELPPSLLYLNTSGCCDVDISHIIVSCPLLASLVINASLINLNMACRTTSIKGKTLSIPHTLQYFTHLTRLELRYTTVDLEALLSSNSPVRLRELVLEGNALTDRCLEYVVNAKVTDTYHRESHVYRELYTIHLCNCNYLTDLGIDRCRFTDMPTLKELTIERCSGIRPGKLKRLRTKFKFSRVSLTCYIDDERPRFHAMNDVEVLMG